MNESHDGDSFVTSVENSTGRRLSNGKTVGLLYDGCIKSDDLRTFDELAFVAKSFRKLNQRLSLGLPDEESRAKFRMELDEAVKRFRALLEKASATLDSDQRKNLVHGFLMLTPESFERMQSLMSDFSVVKDYYLIMRDSGQK